MRPTALWRHHKKVPCPIPWGQLPRAVANVQDLQVPQECEQTSVTPDQRRLRGRMAAAILHSRYDSRTLTRKARVAFLRTFLDQVDPDRRLPEPERLRRAELARRAHFLRLALASSTARKRRLDR
jgi:hypothetical protein